MTGILSNAGRTPRNAEDAPACVHAIFEAQAAETPDAIAVVCGDGEVTYRELNRRANRIAHELRARKVSFGSLVGVSLPRSTDLIATLLGILKAGAAYVPLDLVYPPERQAWMLADATAEILVTDRTQLDRFANSATTVFCLDDLSAEACEENLSATGNGKALAYVIYTSGSTGNPKGVAVPHRAIVRLVVDTDYVALQPDDVVAQAANVSFDAATFEIWGPLLNGARLVILPQEAVLAPRALIAAIDRHAITTLFLTTALFNQVAREAPCGFQKLRHLLFGGEACDPKLVAAVLRSGPPQRLLHVYGPTETTTFASWFRIKNLAPDAITIPIGGPIAGTELYVLDENHRLSETGELFIGGGGIAHGYLDRPELTAEKFVTLDNGARVYRTGDLVRMNQRCEIEFVGRADFQVKIRGFRVELGEIELALCAQPGVQNAVVLAREDRPGDKRLVAYVTPTTAGSSGQLRAALAAKLPAYMVPADIVLLDHLPLTPNGKFDRHALPSPTRESRVSAAPADKLESEIAAIWRDVLQLDALGVDEKFFDLGGNSLLLARIHARLEENLQHSFPITTLFEFPTIRAFADWHRGRKSATKAAAFAQRAERQRAALRRPVLTPT